ncbi:MAG TPA: hypothetical protein K8V54_01710 [Corynebacterium kroppenstedtii]|nr:hypothetical protein [Corynebacterium kroppenstedtii]
MELRNGVYTSHTRGSDCEDIASLARKIQNGEGNTMDLARQIERIALQLARELS